MKKRTPRPRRAAKRRAARRPQTRREAGAAPQLRPDRFHVEVGYAIRVVGTWDGRDAPMTFNLEFPESLGGVDFGAADLLSGATMHMDLTSASDLRRGLEAAAELGIELASLRRLAFALRGDGQRALAIHLAPALHLRVRFRDAIEVAAHQRHRRQLLARDGARQVAHPPGIGDEIPLFCG